MQAGERQPPWGGANVVDLPEGRFQPWERWAWARILRGQIADMARFPVGKPEDPQSESWVRGAPDGASQDPSDAEDWPSHRTLSDGFLRLVLFHPPYSRAAERIGVRIAHARIPFTLDWSARTTEGELWFQSCLFEQNVVWQSLTVNGVLSLDGSRFVKTLQAHRLTVRGGLFLRNMSRLGETVLRGAVIGRDLYLGGSVVDGVIDLTGARIEGELHLSRPPRIPGPVWTDRASLILRNASVGALAGDLQAFRLPPLRRRRPGAFVPMSLAGFSYDRFGGYGSDGGDTLAQAKARELIGWLKAGRAEDSFTPEPYRELASALEKSGWRGKASRILHAMRLYERRCERNVARKLAMHLSGAFIGFGHRSDYAVYWFFALVLGFAAFGLYHAGLPTVPLDPKEIEAGLRWFWFSLGNATPLIELDEAHKTFLLDAFATDTQLDPPIGIASAFYVEKLLGFILLSYLAAGVSGFAGRNDR